MQNIVKNRPKWLILVGFKNGPKSSQMTIFSGL